MGLQGPLGGSATDPPCRRDEPKWEFRWGQGGPYAPQSPATVARRPRGRSRHPSHRFSPSCRAAARRCPPRRCRPSARCPAWPVSRLKHPPAAFRPGSFPLRIHTYIHTYSGWIDLMFKPRIAAGPDHVAAPPAPHSNPGETPRPLPPTSSPQTRPAPSRGRGGLGAAGAPPRYAPHYHPTLFHPDT